MTPSPDKDVTDLVSTGDIDGEAMPLQRCVCGKEYGRWSFVLNIYRDHAKPCDGCGRRLYFRCPITVYEVAEAEPQD